METNDKLKYIDIKTRRCLTYLKLKILILVTFQYMKNHMRISCFITSHTKL